MRIRLNRMSFRNDQKIRAKALYFMLLINPGLTAGVIDNETLMDFSP